MVPKKRILVAKPKGPRVNEKVKVKVALEHVKKARGGGV
jgi:hypothetical protein